MKTNDEYEIVGRDDEEPIPIDFNIFDCRNLKISLHFLDFEK